MCKCVKYDLDVQQYTLSGEIPVADTCNSIAVRNVGQDPVSVNGILLQPPVAPGLSGEYFAIEGNAGEIYQGRIILTFAGTGINPQVEVLQKIITSGL